MRRVLFLLVIFGTLSVSSTALAALVSWPHSPLGTQLNPDTDEMSVLIKYLYEWAIGLGGLAVFAVLVWAGFQYLTSTGDPQKMKEAMASIKSAALGLILLLASVLILNTINPQLTKLQPLVLDLGEFEETLSCENDEDCAENWVCENNLCKPDLRLEPKQCKSVTIDGTEYDIGSHDISVNPWSAGKTFNYQTNPSDPEDEDCMAILELYPKAGFFWGCAGDMQSIYVSGSGTATTRDVVKCIKVKEVPEF